MILMFRNWLRRHNWTERDDYIRALRSAQEYKVSDWRKERWLRKIAERARETGQKELETMALNALNIKEE